MEAGGVFWFDLMLLIVEKSNCQLLNKTDLNLVIGYERETVQILVVNEDRHSHLLLVDLFTP